MFIHFGGQVHVQVQEWVARLQNPSAIQDATHSSTVKVPDQLENH